MYCHSIVNASTELEVAYCWVASPSVQRQHTSMFDAGCVTVRSAGEVEWKWKLRAVRHIRLTEMGCDSQFRLCQAAEDRTAAFSLGGISLPRQPRPPPRKRKCTNSRQHAHDSPASYIKPVYFASNNTAIQSIHSRFHQHSLGAVRS